MALLDSPLRWFTAAVRRRSMQLATGYFHPDERRWIDQAPRPWPSKVGRSFEKVLGIRGVQVWIRDGHLERVQRDDRRITYVKRALDFVVTHENEGSVDLRKLDAVEELDGNAKLGLRRNAWNHPGLFQVTVNNRWGRDSMVLTEDAKQLIAEEIKARFDRDETACVKILKKILMMSRDRRIRRSKLEHIQDYFAFPFDFKTGFLQRHPRDVRVVETPEGCYVELVSWDEDLPVTEREKAVAQGRTPKDMGEWAFVISHPERYTPNRVRLEELEKFQRLPFGSPYGYSRRIFNTPEGQKRVVAIFHELLSFTVEKKALVSDFTSLSSSLNIPKELSHLILICHPGIFYVTSVRDRHYVFLREAYKGSQLIAGESEPLVEIRQRYLELMKVKPEKLHTSNKDESNEEYYYVPQSQRRVVSNQDQTVLETRGTKQRARRETG